MKITIPKKALEIINIFEKQGYEIYVVGGAVRDIIMDKPVYDWDFTTNATPAEMLQIIPNSFYTNNYGTVGVPNDKEGERPFEITTFRTEQGYSDSRRPDKVEWGKTLEEDLERRDFTINAMALQLITAGQSAKDKVQSINMHYELCTMNLVDPFDGQKDLDNKILKAVGNPDERFSEDALRMMRAVRIATELNFEIEDQTLLAIKNNSKLIGKISKERVRDELFKIMKSKHPFEGVSLFRKSGLLQEIIPELEEAFKIDQKSPNRHHIYDVGTHSMMSLKFVAERNSDPITRFATLLHDIGKVKTYKKLRDGTVTFYNHEIVGAKLANKIADTLRFSNTEKDKFWKLIRFHQFTVGEDQTDSAIRRFIKNVGIENLNDMIDLRIGDRLGSGSRETSWRFEDFKKRLVEVQKQPFSVTDLKVSGTDVMEILGISPGPKVGEILNILFEKVVENKLENKRAVLTAELKKYLTN